MKKKRRLLVLRSVSIPQAVWIACNKGVRDEAGKVYAVSIPQAVLIACNQNGHTYCFFTVAFQYRKRYGLHAIFNKLVLSFFGSKVSIPQAVWIACNEAAVVAIGGDVVFQYRKRYGVHAMGTWLIWIRSSAPFQYRKRYGLHAMGEGVLLKGQGGCFNTASGMDCMQ